MHFTDFVVHTCIIEDALGGGGFAGINVGGNSYVSCIFKVRDM